MIIDEITGEWYCIYCKHWYDNGEKCNCERRADEKWEEEQIERHYSKK
jgi:hypothetical protein